MRYAVAIAGLAAAAQAGKVTMTAIEEVTITSCAPTHTACPYKSEKHEWEAWSSEDPSEAKTTDAAHTWGTWDPKDPAEETSTSTWATWDPKDPAEETSTSTWGTWDPVKETSTASATWGTWGSEDPAEETAASTSWGTWDPVKATETATATWTAWESDSAASTADAASCPQYTATAPPAWFSQLPSSVLSSLAAKWTGAPPADWCYYSYTNGVVTETKTPDSTAAASTWSAWATDASATGVKGVSATGSGPIAKYTGAANANAASFVMAGAAAVAAVVLA